MFHRKDVQFAKTISKLIHSNPFLPQRIELERKALGKDFDERHADWNLHPSEYLQTPNLERLEQRAAEILNAWNAIPAENFTSEKLELQLDLGRLVTFERFRSDFDDLINGNGKSTAKVFRRFEKEWLALFPADKFPDLDSQLGPHSATKHVFALQFQVRRAFNQIFQNIIGSSEPIIQLRADIWRSIFTHDMRRYDQTMHLAMADFPTLITGPTGSGKELVAKAIGLSAYIPLNPETKQWETAPQDLFVSLNLSALSPTLIESELFGHSAGAFTGAISDRIGWLETCPTHGAVFLDEIGELDPAVQVKLLRVFEDRIFQRLGDRTSKIFHGRIIAATNRNLAREVQEDRFRLDFFYRLCANQIETPTLAVRFHDRSELSHLIGYLMARITGGECAELASDCVAWIEKHLKGYVWPGNVRELEQCVRSWLLRSDYQPLALDEPADRLQQSLANCQLTAEQLLTRYCRVKYEQTGSYVKTANLLELDRRTVKAKVDV